MSPLSVDVSEVLKQPGYRREVTLTHAVPGLDNGAVAVTDGGRVRFALVIEELEGGVIAQGEIAGTFAGDCSRCLEPVSHAFAFRVAEVFRPAGDVWDEAYVVKDERIDLTPLATDAVLLGLPATPLCRTGCAGLCPACGADLNQGDCGCGDISVDPRWGPLFDLERALDRGAPPDPGDQVP